MADLKRSVDFILVNEGGFSHHPADRGGATNWGVTQRTYARWMGRPVSVSEVKTMKKSTAVKIYEAYYWLPIALNRVESDGVACALFDQGVNRGIGTIAVVVQKIVQVPVDGQIGPKSLKAINNWEPDLLIEQIALNAEATYKAIASRNPSQKVFLKGWLRRANRLRELKTWDIS